MNGSESEYASGKFLHELEDKFAITLCQPEPSFVSATDPERPARLKDLMIVMTDKNLGPDIIKRDVYTKRVFDDHLWKSDAYRRIQLDEAVQPDEAAQIQTTFKMKVDQCTQSLSHILPINEKEYMLRSIN